MRKKTLKKIETGNVNFSPHVTVIVPFKNRDYNMMLTVKSLKNQVYSGKYNVIFVTSDKNDDYIEQIRSSIRHTYNMKLLQVQYDVKTAKNGDKINNMLNGIRNADPDTEAYLFLDSDMVPHKYWIENMVKPLQFQDCGLSSGSAWVVSKNDSVWGLATRYWDFLATLMVSFPFTSFARGLSFGVLKNTFDQLEIEKVWAVSTHDNFTITKAVRESGLSIYYAPGCIIDECFDLKGMDWVLWTKRQAAHTVTFHKRLWCVGFLGITIPRLVGALGFLLFVLLCFMPIHNYFVLFSLWPVVHFFSTYLITSQIVKDVVGKKTDLLLKLKISLASFLTIFHCMGSIMALANRKIVWRGIVHYSKDTSMR